jgi:hypothetical protein
MRLRMANIIPSLRQELAALEADIRSDPRYRKIERIRALLSEYGSDEPQASAVAPSPANVGHRRTPAYDTKKDRVRGVIREVFTVKGSAHRSEILKTLTDRGIMGQEKDPMASLAAYLSDFKEFKNIGLGQWTLASPETGEARTSPVSSPQGETEGVGPSVS